MITLLHRPLNSVNYETRVESLIAIIGWGSLLWDLDNLSPYVQGDWQLDRGPVLPVEFSRVSAKRKNGLVLVIDSGHGSPCATSVILSTRTDIGAAVSDLARRERAPEANIGYFDICTGSSASRHTAVLTTLAAWLRDSLYLGAVWTDLEANFQQETGKSFTISHAVGYLKSLTGESLQEAKRYIDNAPPAVNTPLRRAVTADPWWQAR